jgi:hypothetical protein
MGDETVRRFGRDDGCLEGLRESKAAAYPLLRRGIEKQWKNRQRQKRDTAGD